MSNDKKKHGVYSYSEIAHIPYSFTSRGELRMLCPFCVEMGRKTPDKKGKLYYNRQLGKGHCFRCDAKVFREVDYNLADSAAFFMSLEELDRVESIDNQWFDISWSRAAIGVPEARLYLKEKRGFSAEQIQHYNLRYAESPERGILLPSEREADKTHFFQIRLLHPRGNDPKMSSPTSSLKPLYGESFLTGKDHWNLCEGVFSGISSTRNGNDAVCSYGKSLTPLQVGAFERRKPKSVSIMYDGGEISAAIYQAKRIAPHVPVIHFCVLPFEKDPNDVNEKELIDCPKILLNSFNLGKIKKLLPKDVTQWDMREEEWDKLLWLAKNG